MIDFQQAMKTTSFAGLWNGFSFDSQISFRIIAFWTQNEFTNEAIQ